jgi:hypothetical protein
MTTIRSATSGEQGLALVTGLVPGLYYIRAESPTHMMAATPENKMQVEVSAPEVRRTILCGELCIAAAELDVPKGDVLSVDIAGNPYLITAGYTQEALAQRKRDMKALFPNANMMLAVARGDESSLGVAQFRYQTLRNGVFSRQVPFVSVSSFRKPSLMAPGENVGAVPGSVCLTLSDEYCSNRPKFRAMLKASARERFGIDVVEGESRAVPPGRYNVALVDPELQRAIDDDRWLEVKEHQRTDFALRLRSGFFPLRIEVAGIDKDKSLGSRIVVREMNGKERNIAVKDGCAWCWLPVGEYAVSAYSEAGTSATGKGFIVANKEASLLLKLEAVR